MRKLLTSAVLAASALTVAAPAAAQWAPPPPPGYGYGSGYGYGNQVGYNSYGHYRALQGRVDAIQRQITHLDRRNVLTNREARELRKDSRQIEQRLQRLARHGLSPAEHNDVQRRINRLEQRLWRDARDGRRGGSGIFIDRDRDGRPDRHEDDRGYYPG